VSKWICPFCNRPVLLADATDAQARSHGVIYLRIRCLPCNATIEGAGVGQEDAERQLSKAVERRRGTTPDEWKIEPATASRGRRRTP
jgi:hypothetical protein